MRVVVHRQQRKVDYVNNTKTILLEENADLIGDTLSWTTDISTRTV